MAITVKHLSNVIREQEYFWHYDSCKYAALIFINKTDSFGNALCHDPATGSLSAYKKKMTKKGRGERLGGIQVWI